MNVFIYALCEPDSGAIRYIGKAIKPHERFKAHLADKAKNHKCYWVRKLLREGKKPVLRILETIENSNDLDWQSRERHWIAKAENEGACLTNLDSGGNAGRRHREETKWRISRGNSGKKRSLEAIAKTEATKRANFTEKTRENYRRAQLGRNHSIETREKMSRSHRGHSTSEETKKKIAESQIGKFVSEETREKIRQTRLGTVLPFDTRMKLSQSLKGRKPSPQTIAGSIARCKGVPFTEEHKARLRATKRRNRQACVLFGLKLDTPEHIKSALFIASKVA